MLEKLIQMIEGNAERMAEELKGMLLGNPETSSYQVLADITLYKDIFGIYSHLGYWLLRDVEKAEVRTYYSETGRKLSAMGFPLHEVVQAQAATKRHIWDSISDAGIMRTAKDLDSAVDLITFLNRFFDMATYYVTLGYCEALGLQGESGSETWNAPEVSTR
ncbi:MAG: hypothetical protein JSU72_07525 [Deltaproteobacteria bacterium]|nr:MAG: hypothetical protein JSU72_07525 [Deltaproteobacteria bacterium]